MHFSHSLGHTHRCPLSDTEHCHKLDISQTLPEFIVYVDPETGSKLTLESKDAGGQVNDEMVTLYLCRLSTFHRTLRLLGLLSTLYILDTGVWGEEYS